MSRTTRRTDMKHPKSWSSLNKEEYDRYKAEYNSGSWRGTKTHTWIHPHTGEVVSRTYKNRWYHWEVSQHETFEAYEACKEARFHSDAGYVVYGHGISASFRRCIEKKHRARRNQQLRSSVLRGEEEDLVLLPFRHDIAWYY